MQIEERPVGDVEGTLEFKLFVEKHVEFTRREDPRDGVLHLAELDPFQHEFAS